METFVGLCVVCWAMAAGSSCVPAESDVGEEPVECADASDCGVSDACASHECVAGICSTTFTPAGEPLAAASQIDGDCQELRCDGAGNAVSVADDGDLPEPTADGECQQLACVDGQVGIESFERNVECVDGFCDGSGACVECTEPQHCPDTPNAVMTCVEDACDIGACRGELFDVDGRVDNGCEALDRNGGNHTLGSASGLPSRSCHDGDTLFVIGDLPSDRREHRLIGFDPSTGSAPDWFRLDATGGFCVNDIDMTLTVTSANDAPLDCYRLVVLTDVDTFSCETSTGGICRIAEGTGSYSDDTEISIEVTKTCASDVAVDAASYRISGHL